MTRVLVVDDHPLWRETLRHLLAHAGGTEVVGEAGDGVEAIALAASCEADVIVMDVDVPSCNGIEATRTILANNPQARVLVLSSSGARDQVQAAVRAGACGYLLKTALPEEVVEAIGRVGRGELVFPSALSDVVLAELRGTTAASRRDPLDDLTERERDILALMAEGHSNRAIAGRLHLSPKTVEAHLASIFTKLGLETTADQHRRVLAVVTYLQARGSGIFLGQPSG